MTFQANVRDDQTTGIVGEFIFDGPKRAKSVIVNSSAATPNTVGKAFTYVTGEDNTVAAGSGGGGAFAGILVNPKVYASSGTTAGTLEPTLDLADNTDAEVATMGTLVVNLGIVNSGAIGTPLFYVDATGVLGAGTAVAGQTQITNAKIDRRIISGPGLAIITITEPA